jgi:cytochrome c-type biogenesis protein CcmH
MTAFWTSAAALLGCALLLLVTPLLRRTQPGGPDSAGANLRVLRDQLADLETEVAAGNISADQYSVARSELERRVLDETRQVEHAGGVQRAPRTALLLTFGLPLFAVALYLQLGNREGIAWQEFVAAGEKAAPQVGVQEIEAMVAKLAQGLESKPDNADGWLMLARSYGAMGKFQEAGKAYARASALLPQDAQVLADYADALAMAQGRSAQGEPWRLIQQALHLDPANLKALALAGSAAFERKDYAAAADYWQKAVQLAPGDSEFTSSMQQGLDEARRLAQGSAARPVPAREMVAAAGGTAIPVTTAPTAISGKVTLGAALAARVAPGDTVFIFARAAQGSRMPLAILKRSAADLPLSFTLDDSLAMAPEMKLSGQQEVIVGVRISRSGNAMPQSGDLQGQAGPLKVGSRDVAIMIDQVVP